MNAPNWTMSVQTDTVVIAIAAMAATLEAGDRTQYPGQSNMRLAPQVYVARAIELFEAATVQSMLALQRWSKP